VQRTAEEAIENSVRIWVPYEEFATDVEVLAREVGVDLRADLYKGDGIVPPDIADVEFFVAPYAVTADALNVTSEMPRLKVLQTLTAGYEHALPYLGDGVVLCNARGVHDASTAELALTLMLASLRGIPEFVRAHERHEWAPANYPTLADRHVLILGYGSIGAAIEKRLLPFETVISRIARRPRPSENVRGIADLPRLLPDADVVVVVPALSPLGLPHAATVKPTICPRRCERRPPSPGPWCRTRAAAGPPWTPIRTRTARPGRA